MTPFRLITAALLAIALAPAAQARPAECYLEVGGVVYVPGPCDFAPFGGDGSFVVTGKNGFFAYVTMIGRGLAEGSWNEVPSSNHAHAPLGQLVRSEACWFNDYATVCAY